MCKTAPFNFRWSIGYIYNSYHYHHQIGSIYLSHWCYIFPWLRAWGGGTIIHCELIYTYLGKAKFCVLYYCAILRCGQIIEYINTRWSYSFVWTSHYLIIIIIHLSEGSKPSKCLSGTFCFECVSKIKSIVSIVFHAIYGVVCIQLTHFSYDDCEIQVLYLSIIIKSEVWPICHCFGLGPETIICVLCLFYNLRTQLSFPIIFFMHKR